MENGSMTGFALIGMGPGKVESMTLEAVEVAKKADIRPMKPTQHCGLRMNCPD